MTPKVIRLREVEILRPFAILLLVVMHSFAVYNGSWHHFEGYIDVDCYKWITRVTFSFMLELFVFISGYVLSFQLYTLNRNYQLGPFAWKKIKRLFFPSIVFSTIYFLLFQRDTFTTIPSLIINILSGTGHMWFLPMLFFCSFFGLFIMKLGIRDGWKFLIVLVVALFSKFLYGLPLQLGQACYYLFYFVSGAIVYRQKDYFESKCSVKTIMFTVSSFLIYFVSFYLIVEPLQMPNDYIGKMFLIIVRNVGQILYASLGVISAYFIVILALRKHPNYQVPGWLKKLNAICFGIYLFQQFILQYLYFYTSLPVMVGPLLLPWLSCIITIITSYFLSILLYQTKIGRLLIG